MFDHQMALQSYHYILTTTLHVSGVCCNGVKVWLSGLCEFALDADTCGYVMVNALHRDGGIGNGVTLQITYKALDATVNLQTPKETNSRLGSRKAGKCLFGIGCKCIGALWTRK